MDKKRTSTVKQKKKEIQLGVSMGEWAIQKNKSPVFT